MSADADPQPKQYFIHRTYPGSITSCGGPYATRDEASRVARRFRPANGRAVQVREDRLDPIPRSDRHIVLRLRRRAHPDHALLVGPFLSRREARNFLRRAAELELSRFPGSPDDWHPIETNRTVDMDNGSWLTERRLSL